MMQKDRDLRLKRCTCGRYAWELGLREQDGCLWVEGAIPRLGLEKRAGVIWRAVKEIGG